MPIAVRVVAMASYSPLLVTTAANYTEEENIE
jgi:hypothetical protein